MSKITRIFALCLLAAVRAAKAGPQEDAMLQQVKQIASQGQSADTAAKVSQYVDQNQDVITAILKNYAEYFKQIQSMSGDEAAAPAAAAPATQTNAAQPAAPRTQAGAALQGSLLQTSSGLQMAHLPGYPALPNVPPVTSVTTLSVAQSEYSATVQKQMQAEKQYLMEHPDGYTY